jgi:hypothetical protein
MGNTKNKKGEKEKDYNSLVFIAALLPAIVADLCDMIPVPVLDIVLSGYFKLIVAVILWLEMGGKDKKMAQAASKIVLPLVLDSLAALIPIVDVLTPGTVLLVLFSWFYAAKPKIVTAIIKTND